MEFESILSKLISFQTISETSNLDMVNFISNYFNELGIKTKRIKGDKGQFNFYCRIGPKIDGGILLSGHTDVVPVKDQNWKTNPFKLVKKKEKFYGRGTADMKGFIAVVLSIIPSIIKKKLKKPLHLVFSYDEEIGCIGIQKLIPFFKKISPRPKFCIVGEPTEMKLINQHKGKMNFTVIFTGIESHSSLINDGVNSIAFGSEFIEFLKKLQKKLVKINNSQFDPPYSTINIGKISGGIALNVIPKTCRIEFEIRDTPNTNIMGITKIIEKFLFDLEKKMKKLNNSCSIKFIKQKSFPPLKTDFQNEIISMTLKSLISNSVGTVSFGTEAGIFKSLGFQTIVCGPGSIKQAHKPNEYIEQKQLIECSNFLKKILDHLY